MLALCALLVGFLLGAAAFPAALFLLAWQQRPPAAAPVRQTPPGAPRAAVPESCHWLSALLARVLADLDHGSELKRLLLAELDAALAGAVSFAGAWKIESLSLLDPLRLPTVERVASRLIDTDHCNVLVDAEVTWRGGPHVVVSCEIDSRRVSFELELEHMRVAVRTYGLSSSTNVPIFFCGLLDRDALSELRVRAEPHLAVGATWPFFETVRARLVSALSTVLSARLRRTLVESMSYPSLQTFNLLHNFDWQLGPDMGQDDVAMLVDLETEALRRILDEMRVTNPDLWNPPSLLDSEQRDWEHVEGADAGAEAGAAQGSVGAVILVESLGALFSMQLDGAVVWRTIREIQQLDTALRRHLDARAALGPQGLAPDSWFLRERLYDVRRWWAAVAACPAAVGSVELAQFMDADSSLLTRANLGPHALCEGSAGSAADATYVTVTVDLRPGDVAAAAPVPRPAHVSVATRLRRLTTGRDDD